MEGDRILMAAGVTVAAVVGAFVFFGPNGSSRLRQRRGQIAGLHNFGRTCFLNTLIQALASCPQFIAWLQLHNGIHSTDKKGLISSLLNTLEVVNGTHPTLRADPYSPGAIIRALSNLGWVIPPDEHDAHELFGVILSSLEEEVSKPQKIGCLSDALAVPTNGGCSGQPPRPSSAMMTDFSSCELDEYNEASNFLRQVRSEAHTPDSPASVCGEEHSQEPNSLLVGGAINRPSRSPRNSETGTNESLSRRVSSSCRSLERLTRGPGRVSVWSDKGPSVIPHPFQGAIGNQIVCNGCGFKSTVKYDKFDSITLNLPMERRTGLSLGHLLTEYIASETIADVKCDSCEETTNHTKSLTFAKLPSCLCIHISRTVWLPTGQICKRQDYVHFPESLSMAPYSFVQPHLNSQASTPWGSTMSLFSSSLMNATPTAESFGSNNPFGTLGAMFPKNLYRLLAVVVHSGEANSGHFVTYRRGALRNSHRWYYTSDSHVREVSIDEVLSVPAYLLFYDRGPQRPSSGFPMR